MITNSSDTITYRLSAGFPDSLVTYEENTTDAKIKSADCAPAGMQYALSEQPNRLWVPSKGGQCFCAVHCCLTVSTGPYKAHTTAAPRTPSCEGMTK